MKRKKVKSHLAENSRKKEFLNLANQKIQFHPPKCTQHKYSNITYPCFKLNMAHTEYSKHEFKQKI